MALTTPIKVDFGVDGNATLDRFVFSNLRALISSFETLHKDKLPEWRRLTKGTPKEKIRNFPWPGASNVVIQLIGENVSTIKAVQLGTIYEISPLWVEGLVGDWKDDEKGEEQREVMESFMSLMGLSKTELDLYRVESKAAHDIASLGSVVIKLPWQTCVQQIVTGVDNNGHIIEEEKEMYDGPRPEKLAYEDWMATPTARTWEDAKFKSFRYFVTKQQCEEKVFRGHFDKEAWEKIQGTPDVIGLTEEEEQKLRETNLGTPNPDTDTARWKFYECWLTYRHNDKEYSLIYTAHVDKDLRMKAVFNFYPNNEEPTEFGRLGFDEDGLIGYGFAEMGEMYQEDVATKHNQRNDNHTLCNTSVLLGGNNPRIDSGVALFPMAVLPFNKDEVAIEQLGVPDQNSVNEEQLTIALAKARFGTDMLSAEGNGSGSVDKKGNYNSMGTFAIMQQGARRININITDFRYLHLNLGNKFQRQYAYFGVGEKRLKYFGENAKYLQMALESIKTGRMELPVKAATASINKEVEKQTGMLFTQVMQRHYSAIAQVLQGVTNPTIPPEIKEFLLGSIGGMAYVMSKLARAFGYDDLSRMQPEIEILNKLKQGAKQNGQQGVSGGAGNVAPSNGRSGIQEIPGAPTNSPNAPQPASSNNGGGILLG